MSSTDTTTFAGSAPLREAERQPLPDANPFDDEDDFMGDPAGAFALVQEPDLGELRRAAADAMSSPAVPGLLDLSALPDTTVEYRSMLDLGAMFAPSGIRPLAHTAAPTGIADGAHIAAFSPDMPDTPDTAAQSPDMPDTAAQSPANVAPSRPSRSTAKARSFNLLLPRASTAPSGPAVSAGVPATLAPVEANAAIATTAHDLPPAMPVPAKPAPAVERQSLSPAGPAAATVFGRRLEERPALAPLEPFAPDSERVRAVVPTARRDVPVTALHEPSTPFATAATAMADTATAEALTEATMSPSIAHLAIPAPSRWSTRRLGGSTPPPTDIAPTLAMDAPAEAVDATQALQMAAVEPGDNAPGGLSLRTRVGAVFAKQDETLEFDGGSEASPRRVMFLRALAVLSLVLGLALGAFALLQTRREARPTSTVPATHASTSLSPSPEATIARSGATPSAPAVTSSPADQTTATGVGATARPGGSTPTTPLAGTTPPPAATTPGALGDPATSAPLATVGSAAGDQLDFNTGADFSFDQGGDFTVK